MGNFQLPSAVYLDDDGFGGFMAFFGFSDEDDYGIGRKITVSYHDDAMFCGSSDEWLRSIKHKAIIAHRQGLSAIQIH